ncbi:MAG TPA: hypothetical protein VKD72_38755, partial [Gemmataceae bacterium]|nr:hypothetical protein [Gemmataceae bacterium]
WAFSVKVPQTGATAHRNQHQRGFVGFMNAYLLTGDDRYLDPWRKQMDKVNAQKKVVDGKALYPSMYGAKGWYAYTPRRYEHNARELYYLSMKPEDRRRAGSDRWLDYLEGKDPKYPEVALRADLERVRRRVRGMRDDPTTPDTRLSDDPMRFGMADVGSLVELMVGGLHIRRLGSVLHCRVRYFDPVKRRAGLPDGVAALVEKLTADSVTLTLVNTDVLDGRTLIVQAGGYGEHEFVAVAIDGRKTKVGAAHLRVRLAAGAGARLVLQMRRYVHQPRLAFPWDR